MSSEENKNQKETSKPQENERPRPPKERIGGQEKIKWAAEIPPKPATPKKNSDK